MRRLSGCRIAPREALFPGQRSCNNFVDILVPRPPAENAPRLIGAGDDSRRVSGPAAHDLHIEWTAGCFLDRPEHFKHRVSGTVAAVEHAAVAAFSQVSERIEMGRDEIAVMDIVADAGTIA